MKEAAGEANMTVVTIILIGVIVAVATPIINSMMTNTKKRTCCMDAGGIWSNNACSGQDATAYSNCVSNKNTSNSEING